MEENSNEGLIEPIGSDWLVTDSISLPTMEMEEEEEEEEEDGGFRVTANLGFSNQAAKATGRDPPMV